MERIWCAVVLAAVVVTASSTTSASQGDPADRHTPLDRILDTYVRDGYVYYNALKAGRNPVDQVRHIARRGARTAGAHVGE